MQDNLFDNTEIAFKNISALSAGFEDLIIMSPLGGSFAVVYHLYDGFSEKVHGLLFMV